MSLRKPIILTILLLLSFLSLNNTANAAEGCQMQLSPPLLDYGTLNPYELRFSARNMSTTSASLGKRRMQLNVVCDETRVIAVAFRSLSSGPKAYQFGANGGFSLVIKSMQLDGVSVLPGLVSAPGDLPVINGGSLLLEPGHYAVPVLNQHAVSGKTLTLDIEMETWLTTDALKVRDDMKLEGRGYFDLG
jgi:hypothetical protein